MNHEHRARRAGGAAYRGGLGLYDSPDEDAAWWKMGWAEAQDEAVYHACACPELSYRTERHRGYADYKNGLALHDCPYMDSLGLAAQWNAGWAEAQTEAVYHASAAPSVG